MISTASAAAMSTQGLSTARILVNAVPSTLVISHAWTDSSPRATIRHIRTHHHNSVAMPYKMA